MKAVNLIPADARRGRGGAAAATRILTYGLLGCLAIALGLVTIYVLTNNTIADRKAQLANLNAQVAQAEAGAARLGSYAEFAQLAQTRLSTVRQIAATRFNWYAALSNLAKVVPADTSLQSLSATVAPGGGGAGGGAGALRGAISAPAFEMTGCTGSHDDVARLMSRLRLIDGVTRVTLGDSQKNETAQAGGTVTAPGPGSSSQSQGCGAGSASFDLVVFFEPLPGAGIQGATTGSSGSTPATGATGATTSPGATTSTPATPTTPATPPTGSTGATPSTSATPATGSAPTGAATPAGAAATAAPAVSGGAK